jgi:hypothetical protein
MPADFGGIIYLTIDNRSEWKITRSGTDFAAH